MNFPIFKLLAIFLVTPSVGLAQNATLIATFTNPMPATASLFGYSVTAVGSDRVLIGTPNIFPGLPTAGSAYLYGTNGTLLATFTNPGPAASDAFGISVGALGDNRVIIGAYADDTGATDAGAAYLFSTNGTLLATFTNPAPASSDAFGISVGAVGNDRIIIGALNDFGGVPSIGAAYLFNTNGTLLTTFTNPAPMSSDSGSFGISVAALGTDRVIIGAGYDAVAKVSGVVYLFGTNGTLLNTFTNPSPASGDEFGSTVAAVGIEQVLIGARWDDTGATNSGAAYLFSTNGALLTTFTNPAPASDDGFGFSVAAVGHDLILIGAFQDSAPMVYDGAAYLFSTNGALLTTITNPAPASDSFGTSMAALGADQAIIGAPFLTGTVYLFSFSFADSPSLTIQRTSANSVTVSWPSPSTNFMLQQNTNGIATVNWSNVTDTIQDDGTNRTFIVNPAEDSRFYRLFKP